ncbi:MAG TPA: hypothetical protein VH743_05355 [Beijerinckiaceae bacterium]|jgi:hypothetical protein
MAIHARSQRDDVQGPELALAGASGLIAATVLLASWNLPFALILPVTGLVLLVAGFGLAAVVWKHPVRGSRLSYRDVAALLVFFGFGAALMSDTASLSPLFAGEGR